jgi:hypothetical protein
LSDYGLRASRALGWLAVAMLVTIVLLMGFGLPNDDSKQEATGTVPPGGGQVTFEIGKDDPHNPTSNRFTGARFGKALNVTRNSVVFRSADHDLTAVGTYIEMTSRWPNPSSSASRSSPYATASNAAPGSGPGGVDSVAASVPLVALVSGQSFGRVD